MFGPAGTPGLSALVRQPDGPNTLDQDCAVAHLNPGSSFRSGVLTGKLVQKTLTRFHAVTTLLTVP